MIAHVRYGHFILTSDGACVLFDSKFMEVGRFAGYGEAQAAAKKRFLRAQADALAEQADTEDSELGNGE